MKKEIADKWVEALRSGKYKQGQNLLKSSDKFCCLGVLCDISEQDSWSKEDSYFSEHSFLPYKVQSWADMKATACETLITYNDSYGYSFEQIADIIEENWEEF